MTAKHDNNIGGPPSEGTVGEEISRSEGAVSPKTIKKQTILFVDYAVPRYDMFAGSRTNFMYLVLLVEMGLSVKFLPADFKRVEPYSSELNRLGIETLEGDWYRDNWQSWLKNNGQQIDYVFFHKPDPAMKFLHAVKSCTNAAIIYQCHDLHYLRLKRKAEIENDKAVLDEANFYEKKENFLFSSSDAVLTFSGVEERIIRQTHPGKQVYTVPLFFYKDMPAVDRDFSRRKGLLFVGGCGHTPNRDAITWFCTEVLPVVKRRIPDIVFNVVGANPPKDILALQSQHVRIHGRVSEETLEGLYRECRLVVAPLRFGAGVKGKVIEALYHGVPLVSTSVGLEGIKDIHELFPPRDDAAAFAEQVVSLYKNEKGLRELSERGSACVAETYTSHKIAELMDHILSASKKESEVRLSVSPVPADHDEPPRVLAFYLPQYHPIPENDEWWGKGFTEWRNVSKAEPLFTGHYQPHIPADLGYYDLRLEDTRIAQAELAREYGISGFCYYHYWFNGKRLLERPLEEVLRTGKPDFPFCICWANENWTRRWDGEDQQVLMGLQYSEEDDRMHIRDCFRFFEDKRYIRINSKPLFLVYRTENMPDPRRTADIWREEARKAGLGELYLCRVESIGKCDPADINFDAALEFAPDWWNKGPRLKCSPDGQKQPDEHGIEDDLCANNYIHTYDGLSATMLAKPMPHYRWFRSVTPSWDNTARRREGAHVFIGATPEKYQRWLEAVIDSTNYRLTGEEKIVFVNAWNEWAEGNHLEPDQKHGRAYLEATRKAVRRMSRIVQAPTAAGSHPSLQLLQQNLSESERHIALLDMRYAEVMQRLSEKDRVLAEQEHTIRQQEQFIRMLMNTLSWRITKPLRSSFDWVSRVVRKKN